MHSVDFLTLAGAERLLRVKAPCPFEQSLAAQHFVNAGNAAGIVVARIEKGGVGIGNFHSPLQEFRGNRLTRQGDAPAFGVKLDRLLCPDRPMAEQTPNDPAFEGLAADVELKRRDQIDNDAVVVASVEGDVL